MDDENAKSVKAVLLGESGVGKTCIIARFINNTFENNIMSTTGASYAGKTLSFDEFGGKCIKFEIWDTAGQEKYRALTKIFYKDAGVAILVYDITRKESFDEIKEYWYNQIKECAPKNIVIGIAANKCDLYDNEQVSEDEARNFANEIGAVFKLTSASTNQGIEELFKGVGCRVLDPNYSDDSDNSEKKKDSNIKLDEKNTDKKKRKGCC
jgi:small GTP-binding protein